MKNVRTIFMGTGPFAAPALQALLDEGYNVVAVYTKPLKKQRSRSKSALNPVRTLAAKYNIPINDPTEKLTAPHVYKNLKTYVPAIIVVAAYGKILPQKVLDLPRYGCVNIHASLLPRWRGASPIQSAIRAGDTQTGVTLMKMDANLDTGPIIAQASRSIGPDMHAPKLFTLLADDGARLLRKTLPAYIKGNCTLQPQNDAEATFCTVISRTDGCIKWQTSSTRDIYNQFRAFDPWPGVFTLWQRKEGTKPLRIKLLAITPLQHISTHAPGTVFSLKKYPFCIATVDGTLSIEQLQIEGKKKMDAHALINGYHDILSAQMYEMC